MSARLVKGPNSKSPALFTLVGPKTITRGAEAVGEAKAFNRTAKATRAHIIGPNLVFDRVGVRLCNFPWKPDPILRGTPAVGVRPKVAHWIGKSVCTDDAPCNQWRPGGRQYGSNHYHPEGWAGIGTVWADSPYAESVWVALFPEFRGLYNANGSPGFYLARISELCPVRSAFTALGEAKFAADRGLF